MLDMEIDQQANVTPTETHVGKQLSLVYGIDCFDALNLNNDGVRDDEINAISEVDLFSFVDDWQSDLAINSQSALSNPMQEARMICAFEQPRPECGMNSHWLR
jgi:hypothetical protein